MSDSTLRPARPRVLSAFPGAAGIVFAAGLALALWYGYGGTAEPARVLTAAGLVYLGAAALGHRAAAWPLFGVAFILIGIGFAIPTFDSVPVMLALAAALTIYGLLRRRYQPVWGLPLQAGALLIIIAIWVAVENLPRPWAALLVGGGLLGHAGWDVFHHRTRRVVTPSLAEFCAALDATLALAVIAFAFVM